MPALQHPQPHDRIERRPEVWGGKAVVAGTRIPVFMLLAHMRSGWTEEDMVAQFPSLTLDDARAVVHYGQTCSAEVAADDAAYDWSLVASVV